ncbi:hypothetical protein CYY_004750 [Polysphondylium violaceum]|uniref:Uncharacterized protein n=1 Tax=Polysphondylium violaceum TaxID=133409 RepID=A0A8J4PUW0_9MYCE|nr:hypothetical protein CYY_004750 [Polysphondylium violaceum]
MKLKDNNIKKSFIEKKRKHNEVEHKSRKRKAAVLDLVAEDLFCDDKTIKVKLFTCLSFLKKLNTLAEADPILCKQLKRHCNELEDIQDVKT